MTNLSANMALLPQQPRRSCPKRTAAFGNPKGPKRVSASNPSAPIDTLRGRTRRQVASVQHLGRLFVQRRERPEHSLDSALVETDVRGLQTLGPLRRSPFPRSWETPPRNTLQPHCDIRSRWPGQPGGSAPHAVSTSTDGTHPWPRGSHLNPWTMQVMGQHTQNVLCYLEKGSLQV